MYNVQMFKSSNLQMYEVANVQKYKSKNPEKLFLKPEQIFLTLFGCYSDQLSFL